MTHHVTLLKISQRLFKLLGDKPTRDRWYNFREPGTLDWDVFPSGDADAKDWSLKSIPAYSLAELLEMLPERTSYPDDLWGSSWFRLTLQYSLKQNWCCSYDRSDSTHPKLQWFEAETPQDAAALMLEKLHKEGVIE